MSQQPLNQSYIAEKVYSNETSERRVSETENIAFPKEDLEITISNIASNMLGNPVVASAITDSQRNLLENPNEFRIEEIELTIGEFVEQTVLRELNGLGLLEGMDDNTSISIMISRDYATPSHKFGVDGFTDIFITIPTLMIENVLMGLGEENYRSLVALEGALVHESYHIFQQLKKGELYDRTLAANFYDTLVSYYSANETGNEALKFLSKIIAKTKYSLDKGENYANVRVINKLLERTRSLPKDTGIREDYLNYVKDLVKERKEVTNKAKKLDPLTTFAYTWLKFKTFEGALKTQANLDEVERIVKQYEESEDENDKVDLLADLRDELEKGFQKN